MDYRPRVNDLYWYTAIDDAGNWQFVTKENTNDWEDTYNISMGNCYRSEAEAAEDWYRLMHIIKG